MDNQMKTLLTMMMILGISGAVWAQPEPRDGSDYFDGPPRGFERSGERGGRNGPDGMPPQRREGGGGRPERQRGDDEASPRHQMREQHQAIRRLAAAIGKETDAAKKEKLISDLRTRLGASIDRMNQFHEERLAQIEKELAERNEQVQQQIAALKTKIEKSKTARDQEVEEQLQQILDGKPWPPRPADGEGPPDGPGRDRTRGRGPGEGRPLKPPRDGNGPPPFERGHW